MNQKELQRLKVVENAVEGRLSVAEAAKLLKLSDRQVKRLKQNYNPADAAWVHHGNRGRAPSNAISDGVRDLVVELAKGKYAGFNDTHLHQKLTGGRRSEDQPAKRAAHPEDGGDHPRAVEHARHTKKKARRLAGPF